MENKVNTTYDSYQGFKEGVDSTSSIQVSWEASVSQVLPYYQTGNKKVRVIFPSKYGPKGSYMKGRIVSTKYLREINTFNRPVQNLSFSTYTIFTKESEDRKSGVNLGVLPPLSFFSSLFSISGIPSAVGHLQLETRVDTGRGDFCPSIRSQISAVASVKRNLAPDLFHSLPAGIDFGFWAKAFNPSLDMVPAIHKFKYRHTHGLATHFMELF
ncbi:hypothetical protein [Pararhodonellum marinum]|uniref:hypothetical protein n=1 Tax=Pararhodonellum marinum TaxID=2755358 RepID=UPI00188F2A50|nr:hypothetical protein [Pararhodonellum marinum]